MRPPHVRQDPPRPRLLLLLPGGQRRRSPDSHPADHPKTIYVREDDLTEALDHVIATRVFGPDRHALLRRGLAELPGKRQHADDRRAKALREQIDDLTDRQDRIITELETTDPADRVVRDRLRRRFDALEAECADKTAQLDALEAARDTEPQQDVDLLNALPLLPRIKITEAPERIQRKLYDALLLKIHYDRLDQARFRIVLTDDTANLLNHAVDGVEEPTIRAHDASTPPGNLFVLSRSLLPTSWHRGVS
ncbi:hypothetical protein ACNTMW_33380 [Planosporangium sp. 12N6]|uniref:hypothetical protein n=1 Tax=Planosporangium spinosum TaxID=3402278 RepID=UPI003CF0E933